MLIVTDIEGTVQVDTKLPTMETDPEQASAVAFARAVREDYDVKLIYRCSLSNGQMDKYNLELEEFMGKHFITIEQYPQRMLPSKNCQAIQFDIDEWKLFAKKFQKIEEMLRHVEKDEYHEPLLFHISGTKYADASVSPSYGPCVYLYDAIFDPMRGYMDRDIFGCIALDTAAVSNLRTSLQFMSTTIPFLLGFLPAQKPVCCKRKAADLL